ncbi:hypothetical protein CLU96_1384 [Chryseobacterium sp. 52]|nr:hypothetical protein CLU96_1384 [Chryseobacterium sp. 52]
MKFVKNFPKLILATFFFIFAKNLLQIFFGVIFNSTNKQYDSLILINPLNFSDSTLKLYILYFFLYEMLIIGLSVYLLLYNILFFIIKRFGNKLSLQILYLLLIYNVSIIFFNTPINFFCILIVVILGVLNWYIFKKIIK